MASRGINVHPLGYHPASLETTTFDVIIIGAGPVANFGEVRLSKAGLSVCSVQYELYGGDCHYFACVPSKALLRPCEALDAAKTVGGAREAIGDKDLDAQAIFKRRDDIVASWDDEPWINTVAKPLGVTLVRGFGRITGKKSVSVQPYQESTLYHLTANIAVIVATGSTHNDLGIPGFDQLEPGKEMWINRDATAANYVPEHLVIFGAGAVGTEMATFYSRIGGKVTLIASSSTVLPKIEPEASKIVRKSLETHGVDIKLSTRATSIVKESTNRLVVTLNNGETITGSVILNATGRKPRTFDLGLDTIGLPGEGAPLEVDASMAVALPEVDNMQTKTGNWLYAIGDVNAIGPTTHMGVYQCRIACNSILSNLKESSPSKGITLPRGSFITKSAITVGGIPQVIFTEPGVSTVGHTMASAQATGLKVRAVDCDMAASVPGAWLYGDNQPGWARWIIEEGTEKLVGATYCCVEASEFVNSASVAIKMGLNLEQLVHVVPPFPTRGEVIRYLLDAAGY
ncbi:FAD/NAD(P)-binding domain-containing protein [Periconia macrospinosa]|uniref:FAD/NAD(P)-binding domain-containing protein n=1 Tax=Periconia macrospinosa TaxID=97972 RepID=A0A2V1D8R4_9PLEO|nr:FAD/NAD(P)-binding domain-containing protein [Periconia macrospinosa]